MSLPDKNKIARTFSAAAHSYDAAASLQRQVGHRLLDYLQIHYPQALAGQTIADIGAGSGYFSRHLAQQGAQVLALDLAEGMLQYIAQQGQTHCILADAEHLPLADHAVHGCFSSLAVQWCDLARTLHEMWRVTQTNGWLAVATLSDGSLWQLKHAWQAVDHAVHVNRFLTLEQIRHACQFLPQAQLHSETLTQTFPDLLSLLRDLKQVGASYVDGRPHGLMGKQRWQQFVQAYQQLRLPNGDWGLDYQVVYIVAQKT